MLSGNLASPLTASSPPNPPPTMMTRWRPLPVAIDGSLSAGGISSSFLLTFRLQVGLHARLSRLDEREQIGVDPILVRCRETVRRARVVDLLGALDESGRFPRRVLDGNDLVIFAVHDQRRNVELLEVLGEVGLRKGLNALVGVFGSGLHAPEPELIESTLGDLRTRAVGAVERDSQFLIVL